MTDFDRLLDERIAAIVRRELAATTPAAEQLTIAEYAARWKISPSTVRAAIRERRLPSTRIGRVYRIAADARIARTAGSDQTERARLRLLRGGGSR